MTPAELNYNIYNKELLGIVTVLKKWRAFLYSTIELFRVITDYKCYGTGAVATECIYLRSLEDVTRSTIRVKGVRR